MLEQRSGQAQHRYRMLEAVREFAAEYLDEADEVELIRTRHRDYYLELAKTAEANPQGLDFVHRLDRLFAEHDNMRAVLAWSRDHGETESLARLTVALEVFWLTRGQYAETEMWLGAAANRAVDLSPLTRARICNMDCFLALNGSRIGEVPALANESPGHGPRRNGHASFDDGFPAPDGFRPVPLVPVRSRRALAPGPRVDRSWKGWQRPMLFTGMWIAG